MRRRRAAGLVVGLVCVLVGCGGPAVRDATDTVSEQRLPLPAHDHMSVGWASEQWLLTGRSVESDGGEVTRLFRVRFDGSGWEDVSPPIDASCRQQGGRTDFLAVGASWDGRVLVHRRCRGLGVEDVPRALLALEVVSGKWEVLVADVGRKGLASLSLHPDVEEGLVSFSSDFCAGMARVDAGGFKPWPVVVGEGAQAWRVDEDFFDPGDCDGGRSFGPQWSPDGKLIAFWASPPAGGRGWGRLDDPWGVWLMDAGELEPRLLVEGFHDPGALRWSPDGRWLLLVAREDRSVLADRVLFVYDLAEQALFELARDGVVGATWLPGGERMVVSRHVDPDDIDSFTTELFVLDLGEFLAGR